MIRLEIYSLRFHLLTRKTELLSSINESNTLLLALNANKLSLNNESFWESLDKDFNVLGYLDGIGANLRLFIFKKRIPGVELWLDILSSTRHQSIFLFGGQISVFNDALDILKNQYPSKTFNGMNGYSEYDDVLKSICLFRPTLVIVALGSPKQELMLVNLRRDASFEFSAMGIGGSLDVLVGKVARAPRLIRTFGLEGVWRIFLEPKKRFRNIKSFFLMWTMRIQVRHE